jgi:uncharacterized membrane protein HdeD (DUF308 family)
MVEGNMDTPYVRHWRVLALRGVIALVFGVLALVWPGITLLSLIALFAAYALLGGAVSVYGAMKNRKVDEDWWLPLLLGLVSIGAGIVAIIHPGLTALVLVMLIGANALVSGVLDIAAAIRLRRHITGEWLLALSGATAIIFGMLTFLFPGAGALALIWLISLYAIATGVLLLGIAFRLRSMEKGGIRRLERRVTPDRRVSAAH